MSNDPLSIHIDKLAELLRGFGLNPVDVNTLQAVHIDPHGVTVVRQRLDDQGRAYAVGNQVATETVTIRIDR